VIALRGSLPDRVSLAYRVALLAALAVGTTVGAVCLVVYLTVRSQLIAELDESLHARAHGVVHAAGADPSGNLASLSMTEILASDMRLGMVFQDGRGWPATGSATLVGATGEPELAVARGDADSSVRTVRVSGEAYRVVAVPSGKEQALVLASQLLADGLPFYAHDVLEAAWKAAPAGERELWQGLAQVCVGLTHVQRDNAAGAARLLRRGAGLLRVAAGAHGVDPGAVAGWAEQAAAAVDAGTPPATLRLRD